MLLVALSKPDGWCSLCPGEHDGPAALHLNVGQPDGLAGGEEIMSGLFRKEPLGCEGKKICLG